MTFLRQANPEEIDRGVVCRAYVCVVLLCQLHPRVRKGVLLLLLDSITVGDLLLHGVGVDCFVESPHAALVEVDHSRGPPIEIAALGITLLHFIACTTLQ